MIDLSTLKDADLIKDDVLRARVFLSGTLEKAVKVKGSKNVNHGIVHVVASFNNTLVTITDRAGNTIGAYDGSIASLVITNGARRGAAGRFEGLRCGVTRQRGGRLHCRFQLRPSRDARDKVFVFVVVDGGCGCCG